jgi:hypothetical protein
LAVAGQQGDMDLGPAFCVRGPACQLHLNLELIGISEGRTACVRLVLFVGNTGSFRPDWTGAHYGTYLAEFDFRHNHRVRLGFDNEQCAALAINGAEVNRRTYRQPS